jgi:uncharacterized SAM-binding protein YcdF (DUF218 family)
MPGLRRPELTGPALTGALLAALVWFTAGMLGLLQVVRLPFLAGWPVVTVLGGWLAVTRGRLVLNAAAGLLLVALVAAGFTPVVDAGTRALVRDELAIGQRFDAVVVLSAGLTRGGELNPPGTERLVHAVTLLTEGAAPAVVTTRIRRHLSGRTLVSDDAQARLLALAPESVEWLIVDSVATTRDEAVQVASLARHRGWTRLALVTSPLHSRRACATFRRAGVEVTCAVAPSGEIVTGTRATPGDRWRALGPWLHEVAGWWWYGVRGWR